MTLDELIQQAEALRQQSPLGGGTVVCICVQGIEYQPVNKIQLDADDTVQPSGVVLLFSDSLDEFVEHLDF